MRQNPFFQLYAGDRISAHDFVTIFSPFLVEHSGPLFYPGNVVVTGVQGSGKSMLLSLLKPTTRLAYDEANQHFPVPEDRRKFICSSINLAHSNAIDFGHRKDIDDDPQEIEFLFGDFVNYLATSNLMKAIKTYSNASKAIMSEIGLNCNNNEVNDIAAKLSSNDVWENWIRPVSTMDEFITQLDSRIKTYRRYLTKKDKHLEDDFKSSRTIIGEPMIACVEDLHAGAFIDSDTNIFVDIDQYEDLGNISSRNTNGKSVDYRAVVNRALSNRNPLVSYRIGTRGHAWRRHGKVMGSEGRLEKERDYKYVDLDLIVRRFEDRKTYIFPKFAEDVFSRRLKFAKFEIPKEAESNSIKAVYGANLSPTGKVKALNTRDPERVINIVASWRETTKKRILDLASKDLLSAKFGEVWIRQKGDKFDLDVRDEELPWEKRRWWKKERREIVQLMIASSAGQKPIWCGADELIDLCGGNILAFLSLNQSIWDSWLQYQANTSEISNSFPKIDEKIQSLGTMKASESWVKKISEETGKSSERLQFVRVTSETLARNLFSDAKLSNPGHTGFSLLEQELNQHPDIKDFLNELGDYGNCIILEHTTKNSDRKHRLKWYFNPIFCPYLGLPFTRTKEPYYASIREAAEWIHQSGYAVKLTPNLPRENDRLI